MPASPTEPPFIGIIADDFTGAMDTGAQFARAGLSTRLTHGQPGGGAAIELLAVEVINTNSREIDQAEAARRCREAARRLAGRRLFKKIDSTLRGHVGAEIEAVLRASGCDRALVCPAAPAQGRVVRGGQIYVHGALLHESAFRGDPAFPMRYADLGRLLGQPVTHMPLDRVRQPGAALEEAIARAPTAFITADAETPEDLAALVQAGLAAGCLLCGAFGLAAAWAQALAGRPFASPLTGFLRERGPVLVISGSAHPTAQAQIRRLLGHPGVRGWPVQAGITAAERAALLEEMGTLSAAGQAPAASVLYPAAAETLPDPAWRGFSRVAGTLGSEMIRRTRPGALVVIGGETANHLWDALEVQAVTLLGEAAPGIPCGRLTGGFADGLAVVSKAGGFGGEDELVRMIF